MSGRVEGERERGVYAYFNAILINRWWWWTWPHLIGKKKRRRRRTRPFFASDAVLTSFSPLLPQSCFGCFFFVTVFSKKTGTAFSGKLAAINCDGYKKIFLETSTHVRTTSRGVNGKV